MIVFLKSFLNFQRRNWKELCLEKSGSSHFATTAKRNLLRILEDPSTLLRHNLNLYNSKSSSWDSLNITIISFRPGSTHEEAMLQSEFPSCPGLGTAGLCLKYSPKARILDNCSKERILDDCSKERILDNCSARTVDSHTGDTFCVAHGLNSLSVNAFVPKFPPGFFFPR
jgi:hypothetical protein